MTNGGLTPLVKRVSWCIFRKVGGIWWIWKLERVYGAKKKLSGVYGEKTVKNNDEIGEIIQIC